MRKWSLNVPAELWLNLDGLVADVFVTGGAPSGTAEIEVSGDERLLAKLDLRHDVPTEIRLGYRGPVNVSVRGRGMNVMSGLRGRNVTIRNVVINGRHMNTSLGDSDETFEVDALPKVAIRLPTETILDLRFGGAGTLDFGGLRGRLRLTLSGAVDAEVREAVCPNVLISGAGDLRIAAAGDTRISISGAGDCTANIAPNADGRLADVDVSVSGSGDVDLSGRFGKAKLNASGAGDIVVRGDCEDVEAQATGASDIVVRGRAGRVRRDSSGAGDITIG